LKQLPGIKFIAVFFIVIFCGLSLSADAQTLKGELYFCEDYVDGKEIGVSDKFTTGWLTVMVRTEEPIGVDKTDIVLCVVKDSLGNPVTSNDVLDVIPFDIAPDWDYIYFQDTERLKFTSPGTYKVFLQKTDGTILLSGEVEVVSYGD
jgi:hypothetical protein